MVIASKETSERATTKRKGPPEFRHLPRDRAKILKKQWIDKKKIKAQWKHEKKKQNIITRPNTSTEPQIDQAVSSNSTAKDSKDSGSDSKSISLPMGSSKKLKRKQPEVVAENERVLEKAPQIDRTSTSQRNTNKSTGFQSKKEIFIGKPRRPVTMRERMGSLLEKIQKNHA